MSADPAAPSVVCSPGVQFSVLALDGGGAHRYLTGMILERVEAYLNAVTGGDLPLGARADQLGGAFRRRVPADHEPR